MQHLKGKHRVRRSRRAEMLFLCQSLLSRRPPPQDALPRPDIKLSVYFMGYSGRVGSRNSLNSRSTTGSALLGRMPNGILGRVGASLKWVIATERSARGISDVHRQSLVYNHSRSDPYALCAKVYRVRGERARPYLCTW
jgi:hypothetical protein